MVKKVNKQKPVVRIAVRPTIQKKKKRNPRKQRKPVGPRVMSAGVCTHEYAKAVVDPFDFSACIPDGARGTGVFTVRQHGSLQTGGGTCYGLMVQPWVDGFLLTDSGSAYAYPVIAANWSNAAANANIRGMYESARAVSLGIKLSYTGSTQQDAGLIVLAQMATNVFPSTFSSGLSTITQQAMWYKILPLRDGGTITWRPTQELDTQFKSLTGATPATSVAATFPYLVAYVFGATTSAASSVTYQISATFEGRFHDQTFLPGGVKTASQEKAPELNWYEYGTTLWNSVSPFAPSPERIANTVGAFVGGYQALRKSPFLNNGMPRISGFGRNMLT